MLSRPKVLPRGVRVLLGEAVNFLESTRGEITLTTASQPTPSFRALPRAPHRIINTQVTPHYEIPFTCATRNARRLNYSPSHAVMRVHFSRIEQKVKTTENLNLYHVCT